MLESNNAICAESSNCPGLFRRTADAMEFCEERLLALRDAGELSLRGVGGGAGLSYSADAAFFHAARGDGFHSAESRGDADAREETMSVSSYGGVVSAMSVMM